MFEPRRGAYAEGPVAKDLLSKLAVVMLSKDKAKRMSDPGGCQDSHAADYFLGAFLASTVGNVDTESVEVLYDNYIAAKDGDHKKAIVGRHVPISIAEELEEDKGVKGCIWRYNAALTHVDLILWSDPGIVHTQLHTYFNARIQTQAVLTFGDQDLLTYIDDTKIKQLEDPLTGKKYGKEADAAVISTEILDQYEDTFPGATLVFEGAVTNEDFPTAVVLNCGWHSADLVKVVVSIKVLLRGRKGSYKPPRMILLLSEKDDFGGIHVFPPLEFGSGSLCLSEGMEQFKLKLKLKLLFEGTSLENDGRLANKEVTLDLFKMRQMTYKRLGLDPYSEEGDTETQEAALMQVVQAKISEMRRNGKHVQLERSFSTAKWCSFR